MPFNNIISKFCQIYFVKYFLKSCLDKNLVKEYVNLKARLPNLKRLRLEGLSKLPEAKDFMRD